MITRYRIMDSSDTMVAEANSPAECEQILHHLREQNPHEQYSVEELSLIHI